MNTRHYEKYHDPDTRLYLGVIYQDGYSQWYAEARDCRTRWVQSRELAVRWLSRQLETVVAA